MNEATTAADRKLDELIERANEIFNRTELSEFKRQLSLLQTIKTERDGIKKTILDLTWAKWLESVSDKARAEINEIIENLSAALDSSNKTILEQL